MNGTLVFTWCVSQTLRSACIAEEKDFSFQNDIEICYAQYKHPSAQRISHLCFCLLRSKQFRIGSIEMLFYIKMTIGISILMTRSTHLYTNKAFDKWRRIL